MKQVIVDTGPLVALLNSRDAHHLWARTTLDEIEPPLLTCEAVISEACFLLRSMKGAPETLLEWVSEGLVKLDFRLSAESEPIRKLMLKYASVPMSLADACLVRMTELNARSTVLTLDRDFHVYRRNGRHVVPTIMAE